MKNVLLVDNSSSDRRRLARALEGRGMPTVQAATLEAARVELKRNQIGAAIVSARLPDGSGRKLLREMPRDVRRHTVLLTEDENGPGAVPGLGGVPSLAKPLTPEAMRRLRARIDARGTTRCMPLGPAREPGGLMLGDCPAMREVYTLISKVAPTDSRVLISGESGTGKELVARLIHDRSNRRDKPFIAINCGAIPENLIESELFGHVKGAFTGANGNRRGVFEQAHGGTLFLDEIGEMPPDMQVRLLRVLETGRVTRVGDERDIPVNVRVLAATNRDTDAAIAEGKLREDLVYRLAVLPIHMPPLRERGDDVILLAHQFLEEFNAQRGAEKRLTEAAEHRLRRYDWPGNVRQLRNIVERAMIAEDDAINLANLDDMHNTHDEQHDEPQAVQAPVVNGTRMMLPASQDAPSIIHAVGVFEVRVGQTIAEVERKLIEATLAHCETKTQAAEMLGVSVKTLYNRLNAYAKESGQHDGA